MKQFNFELTFKNLLNLQLWLQFCLKFYVLEMEVAALNLITVLFLTILTVSVDIDVLDVFFIFILNMAHLCLYSLTTRFFIIYNNNREHSHYKMAASTARMVISR